MLGFVDKKLDVLLSTAIIESGLDIPTANTIIVNRADTFGLASSTRLEGGSAVHQFERMPTSCSELACSDPDAEATFGY